MNADHSGVCKFGKSQIDQDNWKIVRSNIKDLYDLASKERELSHVPSIAGLSARDPNSDSNLQTRLANLRSSSA